MILLEDEDDDNDTKVELDGDDNDHDYDNYHNEDIDYDDYNDDNGTQGEQEPVRGRSRSRQKPPVGLFVTLTSSPSFMSLIKENFKRKYAFVLSHGLTLTSHDLI